MFLQMWLISIGEIHLIHLSYWALERAGSPGLVSTAPRAGLAGGCGRSTAPTGSRRRRPEGLAADHVVQSPPAPLSLEAEARKPQFDRWLLAQWGFVIE